MPKDASLLSTMSRRLSWLSARTKIISDNIAKAEIPGYQRQDIKNFQQIMQQQRYKNSPTLELKPSDLVQYKGEVSVDEESYEITKTTMEHQVVINMYRKCLGMIRNTFGRSQS